MSYTNYDYRNKRGYKFAKFMQGLLAFIFGLIVFFIVLTSHFDYLSRTKGVVNA